MTKKHSAPPRRDPKPAPTAPIPRSAHPVGAEEVLRASLPSLHFDHPLKAVFDDALAQAARGKGDARHGRGREFMDQDWHTISRRHGPAFLSGQAEKKLREALSLEHGLRRSEILGAMVYLAMLVIYHDEQFTR